VTFDDGAPSSGNLTEGAVFQRNFTGVAGGTVRFRCTNHSSSFTVGMVGTVEVQ
jgi:plastocyanin